MQPGYLPWLGFFELMYNCDLFILLDEVQYTKKDWRSRNRIRTKDGWIWLTVPVLTKGRYRQRILEARINNSVDWKKRHFKAIALNYSRAPFFKKYIRYLEKVYTSSWEYLIDIDLELITFLSRELGIVTPIMRSSELGVKAVGNERIVAICRQVKAHELYDSDGARDFIDLKRFEKDIKVLFQDYRHPAYAQVYRPFISHMSALDLLLNCGDKSLDILLGS